MMEASATAPAGAGELLPSKKLRDLLPAKEKRRRKGKGKAAKAAKQLPAPAGIPRSRSQTLETLGNPSRGNPSPSLNSYDIIAGDPLLQQILSDVGLGDDFKHSSFGGSPRVSRSAGSLMDSPSPLRARSKKRRRRRLKPDYSPGAGFQVYLKAKGLDYGQYRALEAVYGHAERSARRTTLRLLERNQAGEEVGAAFFGDAEADAQALEKIGRVEIQRKLRKDGMIQSLLVEYAQLQEALPETTMPMPKHSLAIERSTSLQSHFSSAPPAPPAPPKMTRRSSETSVLAPVRVPHTQASTRHFGARFDGHFSRSTPQVLEPGASYTIEELRRELEVSRQGLHELHSMVRRTTQT